MFSNKTSSYILTYKIASIEKNYWKIKRCSQLHRFCLCSRYHKVNYREAFSSWQYKRMFNVLYEIDDYEVIKIFKSKSTLLLNTIFK